MRAKNLRLRHGASTKATIKIHLNTIPPQQRLIHRASVRENPPRPLPPYQLRTCSRKLIEVALCFC